MAASPSQPLSHPKFLPPLAQLWPCDSRFSFFFEWAGGRRIKEKGQSLLAYWALLCSLLAIDRQGLLQVTVWAFQKPLRRGSSLPRSLTSCYIPALHTGSSCWGPLPWWFTPWGVPVDFLPWQWLGPWDLQTVWLSHFVGLPWAVLVSLPLVEFSRWHQENVAPLSQGPGNS